MDYHESADFLLSLQQRRPKLGIDTTMRMLSHLGDPHERIDCVQIAGSNGKGSTARLLESVLRSGDHRVGLFTSPGLNDFREQIRVNGRAIPESRLPPLVERLQPCLDRLRAEDDMPTHFEVLTALTIAYFAEEAVDVAILEVGIGGRYDATSAVDPVASAVTSVSLEHTELLGETVEEIARDKAQVAPADRPLVTGATGPALDAIREETDVITVGGPDADVRAVERGMRSPIENTVSIRGLDWGVETHLKLLGAHQATNAGVAATLARQVADVDERALATGLRDATWLGRFEIMAQEPMVVLDGSHNPGAMETIATLLDRYDYDDLHVVFGAMSDKDHRRMAEAFPGAPIVTITQPDKDRAADLETLANAFVDTAASVSRESSVAEATERAIAAASPDDFVLVTGSLYAVIEARDRWTRLLVPKVSSRCHSGLALPETASDAPLPDLGRRVFTTTLRSPQATQVATRLDSLGGTAVRAETAGPEKLVPTVLSATDAQFHELADTVGEEGHGLATLGRQLDRALDGAPGGPFGGPGTAVMGILNVTPDSFYDGGEYTRLDAAVDRAEEMVANGADVIDVGGESTRPGATPVSPEEERERVVPVIKRLADLDVPVSVDTRKASVADAALDAGADIVNDVSGLSDPEMRFVVADHDAGLVLMHSISAPVDPDRQVTYDDVVEDVLDDLTERVLLAERAGIDRERILVDPGCGFGKTPAESFELVDRLGEFGALGCPLMVGHSRKSMFERVGAESSERLPPTVALSALAAERGADVIRVHDVAENVAAVRTAAALDSERFESGD
jgi:dihydropteroate synthase